MNAMVRQTLREADGRYFTPDERQRLLTAAAELPRRLAAAEQVEAKEDGVLRAALGEMRRRHPRYETYHDAAWANLYRDAQRVVRAAVQAMVVEDPALLDDKVLYWLRAVLAAANVTPAFVRDVYTLIRDGFRKELPDETFALLEPYLGRAAEVLSDFPEPGAPAGGFI